MGALSAVETPPAALRRPVAIWIALASCQHFAVQPVTDQHRGMDFPCLGLRGRFSPGLAARLLSAREKTRYESDTSRYPLIPPGKSF